MTRAAWILWFALAGGLAFGGGSGEEEPGGSAAAPVTPPPAVAPAGNTAQPPTGAHREFTTDFSRASVDFAEILSGGPGKDGIPSIDNPVFETMGEAARWVPPREAVLALTNEGVTHIYPLQILMWHEIVNDTVGELPVAVTWCPLCNTAVAFDRQAPDSAGVLDFGVTGRLRFSNLIMYDRTTESWWQQADGRAIVGHYTGETLRMVPVLMLSFTEAQLIYPDGRVLSRETGFPRSYGVNPYRGYENSREPFLYRGPATDPTYRSLERAIVFSDGQADRAVAYSVLAQERVVPVTFRGEQAYILWAPGVAGALATDTVGEGPDVGAANVLLGRAGGLPVELYFSQDEGEIRDRRTGSTWSASGRAMRGPLAGTQLEPLPTVQHFWFSASAFGATAIEVP